MFYDNNGTLQPKFDLRIDQEIAGEGRILYSAGIAYTEGIIQTPIGPFDAERGTKLAYGQIAYHRGSFRIRTFANYLTGKAPSLLSVDANLDPLRIDFKNGVYDVDAGWSDLFGGRHLMSFGGNVRYNTFDLSICPDADNRLQAGAYIQDEIRFSTFTLALAARADYFSNLEDINFSPRAALIWSPVPGHSFKASFSRAFRAPSAVENFIELSFVGGYIPLDDVRSVPQEPFPLVFNMYGNPDLKAETIDSFEIGYSAVLNGGLTHLDANIYVSEIHDKMAFFPSAEALIEAGVEPYYTSENPPPGWPLNPIVIDFLALQGYYLPARSHDPQHRLDSQRRNRALGQPHLPTRGDPLRQLLLPGPARDARSHRRPRPTPIRHRQHPAVPPIQCRRHLQRADLSRQPDSQLLGPGLLRPGDPALLLRLQRFLHPGQRQRGPPLERWVGDHQHQGAQPPRRPRQTARLR